MNEQQKKEKDFYKKVCLWGLVVLAIIMIIGISIDNTNTTTSTNTNNNTNTSNYLEDLKKDYEENVKVKTNPYEITNEYDGLYKFALHSNNSSGYIFSSIGVISFDEGICKIKYEYSPNSGKKTTREHEGFCGINKEDNNSFYFALNDNGNYEIKTYKCNKNEIGFLCELKSEFDLSGCNSKELKLEKLENSVDINTALTQVLKEEEEIKKEEEKAKKEQEEKEFKDSCQTYTFEQMARNPQNFKGTNVKLTGEVVQVMTDSYSTNLRVNITKKGNYSTYYTDTIYVIYHPESGEDKILEDDIITIYGTSQGDCSYKTVMGSEVTLPNVEAKYITIQK